MIKIYKHKNNRTLKVLKKMAKKMYIPVNKNGRNYKVFMDDLIKVHTISKLRRPSLPNYDVV